MILWTASLLGQTEQEAFSTGQDAVTHYRYEQAIRHFYNCYQADPDRLDCLQQLAWCHQQMGNLGDARIYYQAWAHADSLDPSILGGSLGDLAMSDG